MNQESPKFYFGECQHCTHLFQRSLPSIVPGLLPEIISFTEAEVPRPQMGIFDWFSVAAIAKVWQR